MAGHSLVHSAGDRSADRQATFHLLTTPHEAALRQTDLRAAPVVGDGVKYDQTPPRTNALVFVATIHNILVLLHAIGVVHRASTNQFNKVKIG